MPAEVANLSANVSARTHKGKEKFHEEVQNEEGDDIHVTVHPSDDEFTDDELAEESVNSDPETNDDESDTVAGSEVNRAHSVAGSEITFGPMANPVMMGAPSTMSGDELQDYIQSVVNEKVWVALSNSGNSPLEQSKICRLTVQVRITPGKEFLLIW